MDDANNDLSGSATERLGQLKGMDSSSDGVWLERQLVAALQDWEATEDELNLLKEAREDY